MLSFTHLYEFDIGIGIDNIDLVTPDELTNDEEIRNVLDDIENENNEKEQEEKELKNKYTRLLVDPETNHVSKIYDPPIKKAVGLEDPLNWISVGGAASKNTILNIASHFNKVLNPIQVLIGKNIAKTVLNTPGKQIDKYI